MQMGERDGTFTPGPWVTIKNPNSNYGLEIHADVKVKAKRVVCRVAGPDRVANARLIEAAPDLLAVAEMALAAARMELGEAPAPDFSPRDMRDAAYSALAAARTQGSE